MHHALYGNIHHIFHNFNESHKTISPSENILKASNRQISHGGIHRDCEFCVPSHSTQKSAAKYQWSFA